MGKLFIKYDVIMVVLSGTITVAAFKSRREAEEFLVKTNKRGVFKIEKRFLKF